jgi:hypothetical protein
MTYQPFLIANQRVGKETDIAPFLLPDDAYPELFNAYQYRGVIRKKGGTQLLGEGRLGVFNPTLVAARGGANTTVAVSLAGAPIEPGSIVITDGTTTFTDNGTSGFTITGGTGTVNTPTNYTTGAIDITFTTANLGAAITGRYLKVIDDFSQCMGLCIREINQTNNNGLIAFDRKYSYQFSNTTGQFDNISTYKRGTSQTTDNSVTWNGTDYQFFDYCNFQKAFFETNNVPGNHTYIITAITQAGSAVVTTSAANNFAVGDVVYFNNVGGMTEINNLQGVVTVAGNPFTVNINSTGFTAYSAGGIAWSQTLSKSAGGDGIRWYDGTGWVNFNPPLDASTAPVILQGALLLFAYKGRMVALSTWESTNSSAAVNFQQRARYSQLGNIYYGLVVPAGNVITTNAFNSWYQSPGLGGFEDAPTAESIISAEFIKDVLVVHFERSTWRLVGTNNQTRPFFWEKINTEIGCEATFSTIPFDKEILSIGSNGVYSCDSVNIERVDQKIPDDVFNFGESNNGINRIHGIRDFYTQYSFWTYVSPDYQTAKYPNRILAYNYIDGAWADFECHCTAFGYFQNFDDLTWTGCNQTWSSMTQPWNSLSSRAQFPVIVAGNQQGFVFTINWVSNSDNFPQSNSVSLVIRSITTAVPSVFTVINHNLQNNALEAQEDSFVLITGTGIVALDDQIFKVSNVTQNTFTLIDSTGNSVNNIAGYVTGGRVTLVDNFEIQTKKFTPFLQSGQKVRIGYIDVFFENDTELEEDEPELIMQLFENEDYTGPIDSITQTVDLESLQGGVDLTKFWKRVYFNQTAQSISIVFTYNEQQMFDIQQQRSSVGIHALMPWMAPAGRLIR